MRTGTFWQVSTVPWSCRIVCYPCHPSQPYRTTPATDVNKPGTCKICPLLIIAQHLLKLLLFRPPRALDFYEISRVGSSLLEEGSLYSPRNSLRRRFMTALVSVVFILASTKLLSGLEYVDPREEVLMATIILLPFSLSPRDITPRDTTGKISRAVRVSRQLSN